MASVLHTTRVPQPNQTFDISRIPFQSGIQDTAHIAVEVSAAAAVQASKEFWHMWEPKITKLKGGYSADAELVFGHGRQMYWSTSKIASLTIRPWYSLSRIKPRIVHIVRSNFSWTSVAATFHIRNCSSTSAWPSREVTMRPMCSQSSSCAQKLRESEEAFTDELQLLSQKVISNKPESDKTLMLPSNSTMQINYLITTMLQLQRPYCYKCPRSHLLSFTMSWQGFLASANALSLVLRWYPFYCRVWLGGRCSTIKDPAEMPEEDECSEFPDSGSM